MEFLQKAQEIKDSILGYNSPAKALELYGLCEGKHQTMSQYLESLDPTPLTDKGEKACPLDAFERHLMVLGLELSGNNAASVEKLMSTAVYMVPELIKREIEAGMKASRSNPTGLVASQESVAGLTFHPLYIPNLNLATTASRNTKSLGRRAASGKGGEYPITRIEHREKDIPVMDYGREIQVAYSVVKSKPWTVFKIFLNLIGAQMAADELYDIYQLGHIGDGTTGAATDTFAGTGGTLQYTDLIRNYTNFSAPFKMGAILAPQQSYEAILTMAQFQDPLSGWEFQKNGTPVTPMGAKLYQVETVPAGAPVGTEIVTLDPAYAVALASDDQGIFIETEKIISKQFEKAVVSNKKVYSVIADGAMKQILWT
jgi:hypothetical protein